jgi:hypothetical protein
MILCEFCGNKRCPHAQNKGLLCTNSNEPDQVGVLATDEIQRLRRRVRLLTRGLLFYAHGHHVAGFEDWEAPDEPNWDCAPVDLPDQQTWESMMIENGGWAAAVLRKVFGRRKDKRGWSKLLGEKASNFCETHEFKKPCSRCESRAARQP